MNTEELHAIDILSSAQQLYVMRLATELKDFNQTTIRVVDFIEEQSRDDLGSCQETEKKMALRSHRVNTNYIVKNGKGEILVVYRPNHYEKTVVEITAEAMQS